MDYDSQTKLSWLESQYEPVDEFIKESINI